MTNDLKSLQKKRDALALALERGGLPVTAQEHVRRELISIRARIDVIQRENAEA